MTKIFILTAPFDEQSKTGDGQYAASLEAGFRRHYPTIPCTWLKKVDNAYSIPCPPDATSIPEGTIPSAIVLQPIANEKTTVSGYKLNVADSSSLIAEEVNTVTASPRTPKVTLGHDNILRSLTIKSIYSERPSIITKEDVESIISYLNEKIAVLNIAKQRINTRISSFNAKNKLIFLIAEHELHDEDLSLAEYLEVHMEKSKRHQKALSIFKILKEQFSEPINLTTLEKITDKLTGVDDYIYDFEHHNVPRSFTHFCHSIKLPPEEVIEQLNAQYDTQPSEDSSFASLRRAPSSLEFHGFYTKKELSTSEGFYLAYEANQRDPLKSQVIAQLIKRMEPIDEDTHLDIHIRPPDCGVFITPTDIEAFQEAGIKVNLTIHEYKQNYTRRYLQQYTHGLMLKANTVQFFNKMDRDNAIIAATYGDCDKRNTVEPSGVAKKAREVGADFKLAKYPVTPYNLGEKSGLTVAALELSNVPPNPLDVVAKPCNILSFGTIRHGKGFEEALELARLIKTHAEDIRHKIPNIPIVKLAGDPQDQHLMKQLVEERFGKTPVAEYQSSHQYNDLFNDQQRRVYWKALVAQLNVNVSSGKAVLHNAFIEIHPWCEAFELLTLKHTCKYVYRMDDMGMRNNGSAIISVLDVGVVYAKFGSVTDDIYTTGGEYDKAVDIGEHRFGIYNLEELARKNPEGKAIKLLGKEPDSNYKRRPGSRDPKEILDSIIEREKNQLSLTANVTESDNFKTVVKAQRLLNERFTQTNAVEYLLVNVGLGRLIVDEVVDDLSAIDPVEAVAVTNAELSDIPLARSNSSSSQSSLGLFGPENALKAEQKRATIGTNVAKSVVVKS